MSRPKTPGSASPARGRCWGRQESPHRRQPILRSISLHSNPPLITRRQHLLHHDQEPLVHEDASHVRRPVRMQRQEHVGQEGWRWERFQSPARVRPGPAHRRTPEPMRWPESGAARLKPGVAHRRAEVPPARRGHELPHPGRGPGRSSSVPGVPGRQRNASRTDVAGSTISRTASRRRPQSATTSGGDPAAPGIGPWPKHPCRARPDTPDDTGRAPVLPSAQARQHSLKRWNLLVWTTGSRSSRRWRWSGSRSPGSWLGCPAARGWCWSS